MRRRHPLWKQTLCLVTILLSIFNQGCACELITEETAQALVGPLAAAVESAPALVDQMDELVQNALAGVDDALASAIQETSLAVHQQLETLNSLIGQNLDKVDAILAARIQQLVDFIKDFNDDLKKIIDGTLARLNYTVDNLTTRLTVTGEELLDEAGFTLVRTIREAGKVVAVVVGGTIEIIVLSLAGAIILAAIIVGGIFVIQARRRQTPLSRLIIGVSFFSVPLIAGILFVSIPQVRASVASGRWPLYADDSDCQRSIGEAALFIASKESQIKDSPELSAQAIEHHVKLYECITSASALEPRERAAELAARIERALGIVLGCRRNNQCNAERGEHCEVALGLCTTACDVDDECVRSGQICHAEAGRTCAPPCSRDADCASGFACESTRCTPKDGPGPTPDPGPTGGRPWRIDFYDILVRETVVHCLKCPLPIRPFDAVVNPADVVIDIKPGLNEALLEGRPIEGVQNPNIANLPHLEHVLDVQRLQVLRAGFR